MWRRLEPADFVEAFALTQRSQKRGLWSVCDGYEIRGDEIVAKVKFSNISDRWWDYLPLEDAPDLFLRFTRLYKADGFGEAALAFSHNYGLPSSTQENASGEKDLYRPPERMSLAHFRQEVRRAYCVLALYEAVLNEDAMAARKVFLEHRDVKLIALYYDVFRIEDLRDSYALLQFGLLCAKEAVEQVVHQSCRQRIRVDLQSGKAPDLSTVNTAWDFDDLLGAMYLQMWWLIISGGNITHCEFCGRPISLGYAYPAGRKRRRDTRFCNDACRQAQHRSKKQA
jgi:hypothetical protein